MTAIADNAGTQLLRQAGVTETKTADTRAPGWKSRLNTVRAVVISKLVVLVCLWLGLAVYLSFEKSYAYMSANRNGASFARALEEHTLSTVRGIDQTTMFVKYQYERIGNKLDLADYGRQGVFLGKIFNLIGIADADGWFFMSDRPLPRSNLSDREHFVAHVAADTGQLFISKPVLGRSSGKWAVQFTRRINAPNGAFGGVVITSLDPGYFNQFYRSIDIGDNGMVMLVGTDGIVRARSNAGSAMEQDRAHGSGAAVGQDLKNGKLFKELRERDHGSYYATSPIDGVHRLISFRRMAEYPLVVVVGISEETVLNEYIEHRNVLLGLGALITLLIAAAGVALVRHMRYQQQVEETLRQSEHEARSASKMKSEFLANMSHELRTPMHAILSFAELGMRRKGGPGDAEKIAGYLARIQQSGKRLLSLLNDLLDLSKLEAGRMTFEPAMRPIRPVIDQVINEMSALLGKRGLKVRVHGDGACEQAYFDLSKIAQVLHNLLGNATKFSPENSVIDISYAADAPGELAVSVRDAGPGIPPDEVELVFEQFIQSSKTKTGAGGTGLGLAICRQIVQAHGGRIWAGNNPETGASFTFTLSLAPCQPEASGHATTACAQNKPGATKADVQS